MLTPVRTLLIMSANSHDTSSISIALAHPILHNIIVVTPLILALVFFILYLISLFTSFYGLISFFFRITALLIYAAILGTVLYVIVEIADNLI